MAKRGRPSLLDPLFDGQREKLLSALRDGIPQNTAILASGLGRSTVLRTLAAGKKKRAKKELAEFREEYVQARAEGLMTLHRIVLKGSKKSPGLALRLLSKLDPVNYNPEVMVRYAAIEAGLEEDASEARARAGVTVRRERKS